MNLRFTNDEMLRQDFCQNPRYNNVLVVILVIYYIVILIFVYWPLPILSITMCTIQLYYFLHINMIEMNIKGNLRSVLRKQDNYIPSILGGTLTTHSCMLDSAISSLVSFCKLHSVYLLNSNIRFVKVHILKVQQLTKKSKTIIFSG